MKAFAYVNPTNEKDAVAALSPEREQSLPLGGGQDLLARMKDYITQPERIVNVKGALDTTAKPFNGGLRIGAAMTLVDIVEHPEIVRMYPAIAAAAIEVGTPQIRNQGTVGGNLNQRPRCWYFRNEEFVCLKKGGNRCFAVMGENQF
ncbi:MAG TPA: FAD binding domain-containing protein, partial [Vicinamibacterales bacterium]|nr:FAD binding domain-containing protein [Vicinamibacterales bacterium]